MTDENIGFWNRPWLQVLVGIVVTSGLLVVWIIQYAEPIITAKSELAGINAQIALKQAQLQEYENKIKQGEWKNENIVLRNEKDKLANAIEKSQEQNNAYSDRLKEIALSGVWHSSLHDGFTNNQFIEFDSRGRVFVYNKGNINVTNTTTGKSHVTFKKKLVSKDWSISGDKLQVRFLGAGSATNNVQARFTGRTFTLDSKISEFGIWDGIYIKAPIEIELKIRAAFSRNDKELDYASVDWNINE
ncbi:MAG: hypothetical protein ACI9SP_003820 [Arenicella sp.]|jgi:hypothetical protein